MSVTQSTYVENLSPAVNGQRATSATMESDSKIAETVLQFGRAVQRGTTADRVMAGIDVNRFAGVTMKDSTRDPSENNAYKAGAHAAIVYRGDIWVETDGAVSVGDNVTADTTSGELSSDASSTILRIEITNGGTGYTTAPTISFSGGGGSSAAGTVTVADGVVTGVTLSNNGSGYTSVPTVTLTATGGNGSDATARAVLDRVTIAGAVWTTDASSGGLAVLRLDTQLPSA